MTMRAQLASSSMSFYIILEWDTPRKGQAMTNIIIQSTIFFQHSHSDRDNYITVNQNNIEDSAGARYQYSKCEGSECQTHGSPYDCSSIMHYRDYFFKKAGATGPTMTAKNPATCSLSGYMTRFVYFAFFLKSSFSLLKMTN